MSTYYPEDAADADSLIGMKLQGGWVVQERMNRHAKQTGGNFSFGYIAVRGAERAFLKAFDFERAFKAEEPLKELEDMLKSFNFEVDLLKICETSNLRRIVRALSHGVVDNDKVPFGKLYYLLFELADADARLRLFNGKDGTSRGDSANDLAWRMRCLQQIASALQGLHSRGIFHQDVKPSNILVFSDSKESKLADLGRAHCETLSAPHYKDAIAGAWRYAAPELLYRAPMTDAMQQRRAADLYLYGSMIHFFVMEAPMTPTLMGFMRPEHRVALFGGSSMGVWFKDVLPFLLEAHDHALQSFKEKFLAMSLGDQNSTDEVTALLRYATMPDPELRGHPAARRMTHADIYELQRFVSAFNVVAYRLEQQSKSTYARSAKGS